MAPRSNNVHTLEEWGLGGRAFGNWVTFFLLSGDVYTAYTFVAVPTLVYGVGAAGFFPVPFLVIVYPMLFVVLARFWSVSHVHGFVTPAEFVRARFGSRGLGSLVAVLGIVATMPYIALQLIGIEAVFEVMGLPKGWPLTVAFVVLALYTFNAGPARAGAGVDRQGRADALGRARGGPDRGDDPGRLGAGVPRSPRSGSPAPRASTTGCCCRPPSQLNYVTLALGSALALFLYPHTLTGVLAARNRGVLRRNLAALPLYTLALGVIMLLGFAALFTGTRAVGGNAQHGGAAVVRRERAGLVRRAGLRRDRGGRHGAGRDHVDRRGQPVHPQHLPRVLPARTLRPRRRRTSARRSR